MLKWRILAALAVVFTVCGSAVALYAGVTESQPGNLTGSTSAGPDEAVIESPPLVSTLLELAPAGRKQAIGQTDARPIASPSNP